MTCTGTSLVQRVRQVLARPCEPLALKEGRDRHPVPLLLEHAVEIADGDVVGGGDRGDVQQRIVGVVPDEGHHAERQCAPVRLRGQGPVRFEDAGEERGDEIGQYAAQARALGRPVGPAVLGHLVEEGGHQGPHSLPGRDALADGPAGDVRGQWQQRLGYLDPDDLDGMRAGTDLERP
ncbi:hypothetical protein GCM10020254_81550 [Streptomyces goshikiensis]